MFTPNHYIEGVVAIAFGTVLLVKLVITFLQEFSKC